MYFRTYVAADLDTLYALDVICFRPPFRFSRAAMRQTVSEPHAVVRLACERAQDGIEHTLGFSASSVLIAGERRAGYLNTLDVAPAARGQGIGDSLLSDCEHQLEAAGVHSLHLHVFVQNASAVRLYERRHYMRLRREQAFYGPGLDAWLYRKLLPGIAP